MMENNLRDRILKNDSRFTALPYLLLLQEKREYVTKEGYGHDTKVVYVENISGDYCSFESKEDLLNWLNEGLEEDELYLKLIDGEHYEKHTVGYYWETINVFLTDEGYQEHLNQNKHNLRNYRTFGIHAFRNPEIEQIYKIIMGENE